MNMQPGDVIFYKKNASIISRLVAWFTQSDYTHVALAIGDGEIIEANRFIKTRVRNVNASEVYEVFRVYDMTEKQRGKIRDLALYYKDYPYDYLQILTIAFRIIFKTKGSLFNRSNKLICSELIDLVLYSSGVGRYHMKHVGDVSPNELFVIYDLRKVID